MAANMKKAASACCTVLIFALILQVTSAYDYYADVAIDVFPSGEITISGIANHPKLAAGKTTEYTSMQGGNWLLEISIDENFSDYIYALKFPENAAINYLKLPGRFRMEEQAGRITITGTGRNEPFFIKAQYTIGSSGIYWDMLPFLAGAGLFAIVALGVFFYYSRGKRESAKKAHYKKEALSERQRQIVEILERRKGIITQAELQKETNLPKASLSRNIDSLVGKGIIKKERKGMSMVIYFKEG